MERDAEGRLLVVADSSFLINFLVVDRMDILECLRQFHFHVVNHPRASAALPTTIGNSGGAVLMHGIS